ncbi:GNAT family N-acetyltransferase [Streptomyces sp. TRM70308]|uniref:GNAT family N-acetyltransferase n=1 Tax=Streptomyces sp. TRM70308 TaxID=3131932 RepID=UPI003D03E27C
MPEMTALPAADRLRAADALAEPSVGVVTGGDSLGPLARPARARARARWLSPVAAGQAPPRAARTDGRLTGTVARPPAPMPGGRHRADGAELLTHRAARGPGVVRALLAAGGRGAADAGLTPLVPGARPVSAAVECHRATGCTESGATPGHATDTRGTPGPTTHFRPGPRPGEGS